MGFDPWHGFFGLGQVFGGGSKLGGAAWQRSADSALHAAPHASGAGARCGCVCG
ncbi:MAG: hypothetical protein HOD69_01710 [Marinovum sp.]|nr:hypothetical protein [Marinovum sp.]